MKRKSRKPHKNHGWWWGVALIYEGILKEEAKVDGEPVKPIESCAELVYVDEAGRCWTCSYLVCEKGVWRDPPEPHMQHFKDWKFKLLQRVQNPYTGERE